MTADGEESSRLKVKELFAREKFHVAEDFVLYGQADFISVNKNS